MPSVSGRNGASVWTRELRRLDGSQRSSTHHWWCSQELGDRPVPGFLCCRITLAHWALSFAYPAGATVGSDRSSLPNCPALRADLGGVGSRPHRDHQVGRLGAPAQRASSVCSDRCARRTLAPALHHAKDCEGACLGICACPHRARNHLAVLGSARGAASTRSHICIPKSTKRFTDRAAGQEVKRCWIERTAGLTTVAVCVIVNENHPRCSFLRKNTL